MSTYGSGKDQEFTRRLDGALSTFVSRYNANPSNSHKTIFLFPGGLGSQLVRARTPYQNGPPFSYDVAWLDCSIMLGGATNLKMVGEIDYQQRYILPDGCVDFLSLRPYSRFIQWCQDNRFDLFVFGWDWRLGVEHTVDFFLTTFMPKFEARVAACSPNPLNDFTLIGHSFGGLVVKLMLNNTNNRYVQTVRRAITVATLFYGYGGQIHRFFKGDPDLNWTEGARGATIMTEIISSLPAVYELLFLDEETYKINQAELAKDPHGCNLLNYPSLDEKKPGQRADPYDPIPGKPKPGATGDVRYISSHGFDWDLLAKGKAIYQQVAQRLDGSVAKKFYNIRGVQFKNKKVLNGTVVSQTWRRVPPTFDPDHDPSTRPASSMWAR